MTVTPPSPTVSHGDWSSQLSAWLTGEGLSVQLRVHGSCLHIVFEGRPCPPWKQAIARLRAATLAHPDWVEALQSQGGSGNGSGSSPITYLLLYGRLLGQKVPEWKRTVSLAKLQKMVDAFQETAPASPPPQQRPKAIAPAAPPSQPTVPSAPAAQSPASPTVSPAATTIESPPSQPTAFPPPPSATNLQTPPPSVGVTEPVRSSPSQAPSQTQSTEIISQPEASPPQPSQQWAEMIAQRLRASGLPQGMVQQVVVKVLPPASPERSPLVPPSTGQRRLLVTCLCPEPEPEPKGRVAAPTPEALERIIQLEVAPALTRILRQLPLQDFDYGYGVIKADPHGPSIAKVRVNLQSQGDRLKAWARWGDVGALMALFNRALADLCPPATAIQQDNTLYVFCRGTSDQPLVQSHVVGTLAPIAQAIAPQGIHSLVIYGYGHGADSPPVPSGGRSQLPPPPIALGESPEDGEDTPLWIDWVDLPATTDARRAESTLALAVRGYMAPLAHLVERVVNPDLDHWLATGGRQVVCDRHRRHPDTLQVVVYGPDVPESEVLAPAIMQCLRPLGLSGIRQVVIYGQSIYQSHWESIHALGTRSSAPFGSVFGDLDAPPMGKWVDAPTADNDGNADVLGRPSQPQSNTANTPVGSHALLPPRIIRPWAWPRWQEIPAQFRQRLIQIGLCAPLTADGESKPSTAALSARGDRDDGLLDTLMGMSLERVAVAGICGVLAALALDLGLNRRGWVTTQWLPESAVQSPVSRAGQEGADPVVDSQALTPPPELPSFNSPQFDHQLELYRQFVMDQGRPDVLVVGSSRALRGFDPGELNQRRQANQQPPLKIFNLSVNGATAKVIATVLVDLLPPGHLPPLVIWADGARAFNSGRKDGTHGSIAQSPAYRLVLQDQFPLPVLDPGDRTPVDTTLAGVRTLGLPQPPTPDGPRSGDRSPAATDPTGDRPVYSLVTSREISPFFQDTALGYWLKKLPTEADFNAWLENYVAPLSNTYGRREQLRAIAQTQLQTLPIVDLWSQPAPAPEVGPVVSLVAAGAQRRLGNAPAVTNGKQDGIVDENGFLPLSVAFDPETYYQRHPLVPGAFDNDYRLFSLQGEQSRALQRIIQHLGQQRSQLVFVNVPLTRQYLDPVRSLWEDRFNRFMAAQDLIYLNFATLWPDQADNFSDPSHLNRDGARALSRAIAGTPTIPWPTPAPPQ